MGTQNLTCVVLDGEYRIAQRCQRDGYPSGQGVTVLDFLKNKMDRDRFDSALKDTKWITERTGIKKRQPQLDRDMGAMVLEFVQESACPVLLNNEIEFAKDGLFCEWAYVVDLDNNTLEVYSGFREEELPEGSRFGNERAENGYSPVGLVKTYSLDDLPSEEQFLKDLEERDEDEEPEGELTDDEVKAVLVGVRASYADPLVDDICDYIETNMDAFVKAINED